MVPNSPPTDEDMPGCCQCSYHKDQVKGPNKGSSTRYYIMSHPPKNRSLQACKIRIIYDSEDPIEPEGIFSLYHHPSILTVSKGDQEAMGEFSHENFHYDTKYDYPFGISPNRHGTRRGTMREISKKAARIRLGHPDAAFLPFDCPFNQREIKQANRARARKEAASAAGDGATAGTKKATTTKSTTRRARSTTARNSSTPDDDDEENGDDTLSGPAEYPADIDDLLNYGVTDSKILQQSPLHSVFTSECKAWIRKYNFHLKAEQNRPDFQKRWFEMLVNIVEHSEVLSPACKHQLLFGVRQRVRKVAPDAAERIERWKKGLPAGVTFDPSWDLPEMVKVTTMEVSYEKQMWNQDRRFLWDALESVVEGCRKTCISQIRSEELYAESMGMYSEYFNLDPKAFDITNIPTHPHTYDPPVNEAKATKRKAEADGAASTQKKAKTTTGK